MKTYNVIGFAGIFYTLWTCDENLIYYTSPDGKSYPSYTEYRYSYVKNISTDMNKSIKLYPNVLVDENLKGTRNFVVSNDKSEDLSPHIMKFGKYNGCNVNDIVEQDFDYILLMIDNYWGSLECRQIAKETDKYKKHIQAQSDAILEKLTSIKPLDSGRHIFSFERNINDSGCGYIDISDNHSIELRFKNFKAYSYRGFYYYLPIFKDGKAKRIKGKDIELEIDIIETTIYNDSGLCVQVANVLN